MLLAFAAERRAAAPLPLTAGSAAINRYLLPAGRTAANPQQRQVNDGTKGHTNARPLLLFCSENLLIDNGPIWIFVCPCPHELPPAEDRNCP